MFWDRYSFLSGFAEDRTVNFDYPIETLPGTRERLAEIIDIHGAESSIDLILLESWRSVEKPPDLNGPRLGNASQLVCSKLSEVPSLRVYLLPG